ncbi:MAG: glycosyltransferase family 2 protein [Candidatus Daviesbacteria bacterium]|nr:glycosyltransferase family 2 protein [Candidatus Daviesbacteria bacterium]
MKDGISLIIPVLNEEKTIATIIKKCASQSLVSQLVIVNDGSTDQTRSILNKIRKKNIRNPLITILSHESNMGKGAAIKTGLTEVLGKYVMVQDADLEYSPDEIKYLFNEAQKTKDGIVFGTRSHHRKKGYILAQLGNWYLNLMFNFLFGYHLSDSYTCYKLIPKIIWQKMDLQSNGFEIDAELVAKMGMQGYQIKEVPITYFPRKYAEGKKIKWLDLFKATGVAIKVRFLASKFT